jgi:hypothetical protein
VRLGAAGRARSPVNLSTLPRSRTGKYRLILSYDGERDDVDVAAELRQKRRAAAELSQERKLEAPSSAAATAAAKRGTGAGKLVLPPLLMRETTVLTGSMLRRPDREGSRAPILLAPRRGCGGRVAGAGRLW